MFILETTKEDLKLAKQEILSLSNSKILKYNNLFISDCDYTRLALVNFVYKDILEYKFNNNSNNNSNIDTVFNAFFNFETKFSFKFEYVNVDLKKAHKLISKIKEKGAVVNLKNPDKIFSLIKFKSKIYFCERIYVNSKDYLKRNPKLRPEFHPGACSSKFAKTLVNLSSIKKNNELLDPFCGTGGILIEAEFMGIKSFGSDLNRIMINRSRINLEHYKLNPKLIVEDALQIKGKYSAIVTELPFGKTTKIDFKVPKLFKLFLENIYKHNIADTVVVGLPSKFRYDYKKWTKVFDHNVYLHKSLSKRILVLKRNN